MKFIYFYRKHKRGPNLFLKCLYFLFGPGFLFPLWVTAKVKKVKGIKVHPKCRWAHFNVKLHFSLGSLYRSNSIFGCKRVSGNVKQPKENLTLAGTLRGYNKPGPKRKWKYLKNKLGPLISKTTDSCKLSNKGAAQSIP